MAPGSEKAEQAAEDSAPNRLAPNRSSSSATGRMRGLVVHSSGNGKTTSVVPAVLAASRANPKAGLHFELKGGGGVSHSPLAAHLAATLSLSSDIPAIDLSLRGSGKGLPHWQLLHRDDGTTRLSALFGVFQSSDSRETARQELAAFVQQYTSSIARSSVFLSSGGGSGPFITEPRKQRKPEKPLIEQIKAPMSSTEAQGLSERLNAENGPRRKLPPRP